MPQQKSIHIIPGILSLILFVLICRSSFYTEMVPLLHYTLSAMRFACFGIFLVLFALQPRRMDKLGFWMLMYGVVMAYSSYRALGTIPFTIISVGIDLIMLWGVCKIYLPKYSEVILRILIVSMSFCIYVNLLLMFIYPSGIWHGYFLLGGNYNQMGRVLIPALAIHGYYTILYKKWKVSFYLLFASTILTLFMVGSMTSMVGVMMLLLFLFIRKESVRKWYFIGVGVVFVAFQIAAVFIPQDFTQIPLVSFFVQDVLHKDLSFTNRSSVWIDAWSLFDQSPVWGNGYQSADWYLDKLAVLSEHNQILHILVSGGVVGLVTFIPQVVYAIVKYVQNRNRATQFLFFGLCTFAVMMIMEVYRYAFIALLLILLYDNKAFAEGAKLSQPAGGELPAESTIKAAQ